MIISVILVSYFILEYGKWLPKKQAGMLGEMCVRVDNSVWKKKIWSFERGKRYLRQTPILSSGSQLRAEIVNKDAAEQCLHSACYLWSRAAVNLVTNKTVRQIQIGIPFKSH